MDKCDLESFLNNSEMGCTNEWELNSFDLDLVGDADWDQYIQEPPSSENSGLESPKSPANNVEESEKNMGMNWSSSNTNLPSILSFGDPTSPVELEAIQIPVMKKRASNKSKTARSRPDYANREHVLAERKRREKITENLYALSGLVPGLKKRDKASVLTKTIEYMKQMQERVKTLEEQVVKGKNGEDQPTVEQSKPVSVSSTDEQSPKIEIKTSGNTYLMKIHCFQASKGILVTALNLIESLHLRVVSANFVQFSEQILDLTITSQVEEGFEVSMNDLFKKLKSALNNLA